MYTLNEIKLNEKVIIKRILGDNSLKRRLLDLGFIPGEVCKCVLVSPFNDPKAYLINNSVIALRNNDAQVIEVSYE